MLAGAARGLFNATRKGLVRRIAMVVLRGAGDSAPPERRFRCVVALTKWRVHRGRYSRRRSPPKRGENGFATIHLLCARIQCHGTTAQEVKNRSATVAGGDEGELVGRTFAMKGEG